MTQTEFYNLSNGITLTETEWWQLNSEYNRSPLSKEEFVKEWLASHPEKAEEAKKMADLNRQLGVLNDLKWDIPSVSEWYNRSEYRRYLNKKLQARLAKHNIRLNCYSSANEEIDIQYIHQQIDHKRKDLIEKMDILRKTA